MGNNGLPGGCSAPGWSSCSKNVKIGVKIDNPELPEKIKFTTKHTALPKSGKGKPILFKEELLVDPQFTIIAASEDNEVIKELATAIKNHTPKFAPFLGAAFCLARLEFVAEGSSSKIVPVSETFTTKYAVSFMPDSFRPHIGAKAIVEGHNLYQVDGDRLVPKYNSLVMPVNGVIEVDRFSPPGPLSGDFIKLSSDDEEIVNVF